MQNYVEPQSKQNDTQEPPETVLLIAPSKALKSGQF